MADKPEPKKKGGLFSSIGGLFGSKKPAAKKESSGSDSELNEEEYLVRNMSAEQVDSDDMAGGLCYSDEEPASRGVFKAMRKEKRKGGGAKKARRAKVVQEFDTNVFEVQLDCLAQEAELATGDAEICNTCTAVFNKYSKTTEEKDQQIWCCEFCNVKNEV